MKENADKEVKMGVAINVSNPKKSEVTTPRYGNTKKDKESEKT